jgi:two-component sensor histidine kinase
MQLWVRNLAEQRLPAVRSNPGLAWGAGIGLFAAAFTARWLLDGVLPVGVPFITFFLAILLATLVGGVWVGLAVMALALVSSWYFFVYPSFSFRVGASGGIALAAFVLCGGAIVAIGHELNLTVERFLAERRRADALLQEGMHAEEQLERLNRELLHRIRNIFTLAISIANQTSRHAATPEDMANAISARFQALAVAQELLVANRLSGADLQRIALRTLEPLSPASGRLALSGPVLQLIPEATTSLCLVLHELGTNAVKYGAWSNNQGTVRLEWSLALEGGTRQQVMLRWRETNGPPCGAPSKTGLGTILIDSAVAGATVEREFRPEGLSCSMRFAQPQAAHIPLA